jgi:integrase
MGDIIRRGTKDRPRFYVRYKDANGTRKLKAAKVSTLGEARSILAAIETRIAKGEVGIVEKTDEERARAVITVKHLGEKFIDEKTGYTNPKVKDIAAYRKQAKSKLEVRIYPRIGSRSVASLEVTDIERLRDDLLTDKENPLKPASVTLTIAVLSKMFNWALRQKLIDVANPVKGCVRPVSRHAIDFLDKEEVANLLEHAEQHTPDLHPFVATAIYTGMRKGELLGARWINVHLDAARIDVVHSYDGAPKSGKDRPIPLHPELVRILRVWKKRCPATPQGLMFPVPDRGKLRMGTQYDSLGADDLLVAAKCHVPEKPIHCLRHTFASHFMMSGGNILTLQKLMGHSTLAMTMRYAHLSPDHLAAEVARMSFHCPVADVADMGEARRKRDADGYQRDTNGNAGAVVG